MKIWEWSGGSARLLHEVATPDVETLAILPHGRDVIAAHRNRAVVIREAATGRELRRLQSSSAPFSLAVSPDRRLLAVGTWLGAVDLFDLETGARLQGMKGQTALINGVDFSPDGSLLAVASRDGTIQLWDVATRQSLATVSARRVGAERVRFFPDGRRLAIGYEDGEVETRDLWYFFRYAAGQAEYQLRLLRDGGESFPRAGDVLAWSRRILSTR